MTLKIIRPESVDGLDAFLRVLGKTVGGNVYVEFHKQETPDALNVVLHDYIVKIEINGRNFGGNIRALEPDSRIAGYFRYRGGTAYSHFEEIEVEWRH